MKKKVLLLSFSQDLIPRHESMVKTLVAAECFVTVLTWNRSDKSQLHLKDVRYLSVDLAAPISSPKIIFSLPKYYSAIARLLENEEAFDICFLTHMMTLPLMKKVPTHSFVYDISEYLNYDLSDYFGAFRGAIRPAIEFFEKFFIRRVSGVTYVGSKNNWLGRYVQKAGAKKTIEINNFPDLYRCPDKIKKAALSARYSNKKVIVYAGGLSVDRGVMSLAEVTKLVLQQEPKAHFVFMGRFRSDTHLIIDKIRELGVESSVEFIQHVDFEEMLAYLAVAELGVALYEVESSNRSASDKFGKFNSRKILTYMQMELPILVSAGNPFADFVLENHCGEAIDTRNLAKLSEKIVFMLNNLSLWNGSGKRSIQLYNWQNEEHKFIRFVKDVCA